MTNYTPINIDSFTSGESRYLDKIEDNGDVLDIFISTKGGTKIRIKCDSYLLYMRRDEGDAIRTVSSIAEDASFDALIFSVRRSWLLSWFVAECEGMRKEENLKHFIVACADDIVDIISVDDLVVEVSHP
jgi:hypothetical protein